MMVIEIALGIVAAVVLLEVLPVMLYALWRGRWVILGTAVLLYLWLRP